MTQDIRFKIHNRLIQKVNILRQVKSQSKILRRLKSQSKMILTFSTEFIIYKIDPLIWTQLSPESESLDKEDLGLLAGEASPKALFRGGSIIRSNAITHVLTNSREMTLKSDSFPFDPLKAQTLMITPLTEPFLTSDGDVCSTIVIGASRPEHSRIIAPFMNEDISSRDDVRSTV